MDTSWAKGLVVRSDRLGAGCKAALDLHHASRDGPGMSSDELLLSASRNGTLDDVKRALEAGANVNAVGNYGNVPLHKACSTGHLDIVEYLISKGANLHAEPEQGYSALHCAATSGTMELLQFLINKVENANPLNRVGESPLASSVARTPSLEPAALLLNGGAAVDTKKTSTGGRH